MKYIKKPIVVEAYQTEEEMDIETLEGVMHASVGDYIITGVHGEQYPCKPDIFKETYDTLDEMEPTVYMDVEDISQEWETNLTELTEKERSLDTMKEEYENLSEEIIQSTDFQKLYGKNNDKVRKSHVRRELSEMYDLMKKFEYEVEYLKRRISFLKAMVYVKIGEK